jgi:hypothetical protein
MQRKLAHLVASPKVSRACLAVAEMMQQGPEMPWLLDRIEAALGIATENEEAGLDGPT